MDGLQGQLKQSMQFRLSAWLSLVILSIAVAAGAFSFFSAFNDANEIQDDQLRQIASLVDHQLLPVQDAKAAVAQSATDNENLFVVQTLPPVRSVVRPVANGAIAFPANLADGLQTVSIGSGQWRIFVLTRAAGPKVAVGQRTDVRDEIARDGALRTVLPFVILVPVLLLLVSDLVRRMFMPLKRLASEIDHRSEQDLRAVGDAGLPSEVRPFVVAINRLLSRVSESAALQRRFVADAAHELRSPLTALSLQAERLDAAEMSTQAKERLGTLRQGLQRTRALLDQLLTFARLQEDHKARDTAVSVQHVFRQVVEDLMPLAQHKQIDLGVVGEEDASLVADAIDLKTMVKNLVENAIRYTPRNGRVDLSLRTPAGQVVLRIDDTGPGIPEDERERVFDPFYRVLGQDEEGSGLGLSIVNAIARRLGAVVTLQHVDEKRKTGLSVAVAFPAEAGLATDAH